MSELSPRYNSKEVEAKWYPLWESKGYFRPRSDREGKKTPEKRRTVDRGPSTVDRYVIVIPPPNVTGILHMGHALNNSIQDILTRWNRMKGKDTLWIPGVDHAGIATQNVVEKKLAKEKKSRHELGREKFLQEVWKWKEEHGNTITRQLRRLGSSCDWSRERFTMDEGLSRAVREAFVTLYERGLIYQGHYIINWCPRCQTALSDEEAAHKDIQGALYHIKYPLTLSLSPKGRGVGEGQKDTIPWPAREFITVATTRPETMLGDTAVAVNPNDERYKNLIGKKVLLPLIHREIPVIADEFVDPQFGTGIVKVTPAHDPNDFEMGRRHNLAQVNVMNPNGTMNENAGPYKGMDRFAARKKIIADLEEQGLFEKKETHSHAVGHCYRCDTVVEPYLSKQWFVKMKPLAEKALKAHREGKTKFYPDRWTKVYTNWLEGIRDWCISRQIWWGHQIPVWYCDICQTTDDRPQTTDKGRIASSSRQGGTPRNDVLNGTANNAVIASEAHFRRGASSFSRKVLAQKRAVKQSRGIIVAREIPAKCPTCGNTKLHQDPDVLDTWFSSWLWPFSTLGWPATEPSTGKPEQKDDLKYFYPTSDLITAPEIIFFWVARMIMAGLEFQGEVPFSRIYIHGTVRAQSGLKMSKSLGNAIDPLEVIEEIGADALRYSMIMLSAQDVYLSREKFEVGRNFTNKIWNASRFALMNLQNANVGADLCVRSESDKETTRGSAPAEWSLPNRWILSRLEVIISELEKNLSVFGFSQAATDLYHFVWNDFCDWYIELSKPVFEKGTDTAKKETQQVLFYVLEKTLRLLHPFMPFVTEEIWQKLKEMANDKAKWPESIMLAAWPGLSKQQCYDKKAEKSVEWMQKAVGAIRDLRSRVHLAPSQTVEAVLVTDKLEVKKVFTEFVNQIKVLGKIEPLNSHTKETFQKSKAYLGSTFPDFEVFIKIEGLVNYEEEKKQIEKKIKELEGWIKSISTKLANQNFVKNAPAEIVDQEYAKLEDAQKVLKSQQELLELFR